MAYLPTSKPPRAGYTAQLPRTLGGLGTGRGTVSKPRALPKPRLSKDAPALRKRQL